LYLLESLETLNVIAAKSDRRLWHFDLIRKAPKKISFRYETGRQKLRREIKNQPG
jgi:hypothetical protein